MSAVMDRPPAALEAHTEVRLAEPEDRSAVLALLMLLHGENGLFAVSPTKVDAMLDRYYGKEGAVMGVIGPIGAPVAVIYLSIAQMIYSDEWFLNEELNFVHPEHRRSHHADHLIAYAKEVADGIKLPLMLGILSNSRTEAKVRLYERQLEKAGAFFIHNRRLSVGANWEV